MAEMVGDQFDLWRSGQHVGAARPVMRVFMRRGRFRRNYRPWAGRDVGAFIPGEHAGHVWSAEWGGFNLVDGEWAFDDWLELPNVLEVGMEQTFDESGINRATITVENVQMVAQAIDGGAPYHTIDRGHFSPWRGYQAPGLPKSGQAANNWYGRLFRNAQIMVWQGYGEAAQPTFTGLIDDVDVAAKPDRITLTMRDFGQQLTDSRVFEDNMSKSLKDPIRFHDRRAADKRTRVGAATNRNASSWHPGRPVKNVADEREGTRWYSGDGNEGRTEWCEIVLPDGRYEEFVFMAPMDFGHEVHFALHVVNHGNGTRSTLDGRPIAPGWLDVDAGTAPGSLGHPNALSANAPYFKLVGKTHNGEQVYSFPGILRLGAGSKLVAFMRKPKRYPGFGHIFGCTTLRAIKRRVSKEARQNKWVLVDDVTDIVKVVLRWAGFKEWVVETAGVRLSEPYYVNRGNFYIDIIKKVADMLGYVFFMGDPTSEDSIGVPTLRSKAALRSGNHPWIATGRPKPTIRVRDTGLLTAMQMKFTDEPLATIIRVRGKMLTYAQGGYKLGGETTHRRMFVYVPPWTAKGRMGGLLKHVVHYDPVLKSAVDVEVAAMLIALAEALASATCTFELPANPQIELDDQLYVEDSATGVATRVWIASRQSTFATGQNTKWVMSLGGSLIDTPDIADVRADVHDARARRIPIPPPPVAYVSRKGNVGRAGV